MGAGYSSRVRLEALIEFVAAVHESRSLDELRSAYLSSVVRLIPADAHGFYFLDPTTGLPDWVAVAGADPAFLDCYEDVGRDCDPLLAYVRKTGEPAHEHLLFSSQEWKREPLREVMGVQNLDRLLQAPVFVDSRLRATLNFARHQGGPAFSDSDLRLLRVITTHVSKALECMLSEDEKRNRLALAEAVLESLGAAIIVTDEEGRLYLRHRGG